MLATAIQNSTLKTMLTISPQFSRSRSSSARASVDVGRIDVDPCTLDGRCRLEGTFSAELLPDPPLLTTSS